MRYLFALLFSLLTFPALASDPSDFKPGVEPILKWYFSPQDFAGATTTGTSCLMLFNPETTSSVQMRQQTGNPAHWRIEVTNLTDSASTRRIAYYPVSLTTVEAEKIVINFFLELNGLDTTRWNSAAFFNGTNHDCDMSVFF